MTDKNKQTDLHQKPKKDLTATAMENNPCGICRYKFPVCRGHSPSGGGDAPGGGGGESGPGGGNRESEFKILDVSTAKNQSDIFYIKSVDGPIKVVDSKGHDLKNKELEVNILFYNFQELFKQQLEIKSNLKDSLTIKIRPDLTRDSKELLIEFLNILKNECDTIVLGDPKNKFLAEGYRADIDETKGELNIYVPNQKQLFHDIIKNLSQNSSVLFEQAKQKIAEKQQIPSQDEKNSIRKTPTPFKTTLTK